MSEHLTLHPFPEDELTDAAGMPKTADYLHYYNRTWDQEARGLCWLWVFEEAGRAGRHRSFF